MDDGDKKYENKRKITNVVFDGFYVFFSIRLRWAICLHNEIDRKLLGSRSGVLYNIRNIFRSLSFF